MCAACGIPFGTIYLPKWKGTGHGGKHYLYRNLLPDAGRIEAAPAVCFQCFYSVEYVLLRCDALPGSDHVLYWQCAAGKVPEGLSCGRVYHLCEFCTMHGLTVTEYCRFYLDIVLVPSGDRRNVPDNIYYHLPGWFSVFLFWHGFTGKVEKSMLYLTYLNSK